MNKTPEKELKQMETSNLPDAEFKTLVIRMSDKISKVQFSEKTKKGFCPFKDLKKSSAVERDMETLFMFPQILLPAPAYSD